MYVKQLSVKLESQVYYHIISKCTDWLFYVLTQKNPGFKQLLNDTQHLPDTSCIRCSTLV